MNTATITVQGIETKEGTSAAGKPWKLVRVKAAEGGVYATFDQGLGQQAGAAVGRRANITYETTEKGDNLKSLVVDESAPAALPAAVVAQKPNGDVDWDRIGLHKTRCALWAALFSGGTLAGIPETAALVMGCALVAGAEADIFNRAPSQAPDDFDGIPFAWVDGYGLELGVHYDPWRPR